MSIQAMTWALSIPIPPSPKLTLVAIGNYADEHGHCFPSIKRLAHDSSQSYDTVMRRLRELEGMGLLVRIPRFITSEGVLNSDGKGRRTSDELRLRLDVTPEQINERVSASHGDGVNEEKNEPGSAEPYPQSAGVVPQAEGGNLQDPSPQGCAGTGVALLRDQEPSLEPKEDSPPPPKGGNDHTETEQQSEPTGWPGSDSWPDFERAYSEPILRQSIARQVWSALSDDERAIAIKAAKGYVAWRRLQKKPPNVINAHTFLRERDGWAGFAKLAPAELPPRLFVAEGSTDFEALRVLQMVRGGYPLEARFDTERAAKGVWRHGIVPVDLAALAQFAAKPIEQWSIVERDSKPFFAWADRIHKWTGQRVEAQRIETGGEHPFTWNNKTTMVKNTTLGLRVPCLYPPRKDGSVGPEPDTS